MDNAAPDEELMNRYRDGDAHAFEVLYTRHKGPLYRYLLRQCGAAALAEELFQDVWMKLIRARERYEARAKFTTYLYHLAHNRLIDHYRHAGLGASRTTNSTAAASGSACWSRSPPCPRRSARPSCWRKRAA